MMPPYRWLLAAVLLLACSASFGCADALDLFEIQAYEESDDPETRRTGEALREIREEREVRNAMDMFYETGDPAHLEAAKSLRPNDTGVRGAEVVLATLDGDPEDIEAAKQALALAEARRLAALDLGSPVTSERVRRNVLGEILVAQTNLLGGSLTEEWSSPAADAPERTKRLYTDYCATRNEIMTQHNDDLAYLPLPPCP